MALGLCRQSVFEEATCIRRTKSMAGREIYKVECVYALQQYQLVLPNNMMWGIAEPLFSPPYHTTHNENARLSPAIQNLISIVLYFSIINSSIYSTSSYDPVRIFILFSLSVHLYLHPQISHNPPNSNIPKQDSQTHSKSIVNL